MKSITMAALLALVPTALMAQQDSTRQTPRALSVETRAQLDATLRLAREKDLPEEPIQDRIAEGQAKGATDAQIVLAARKMSARLEAAQSAMIRAGRQEPSPQEVESGATAIERGATSAQMEVLTKSAPSERSLVVAFDVLASLASSGRPVAGALSQIQGNLDSRASANGSVQGAVGSTSASVGSTASGAVRIIRP